MLLLAAHLRHAGVLWTEETLPLAAALAMKSGAVLHRDIWFDKPPLVPAVYLLWGAQAGWVLRMAGALYALLASWLAGAIAARLWSAREGYIAAGLMAFFLTFDTHSAVLPLAADLLLLVPHLAAIYFCIRRQALWCGLMLGVGLFFNTKAVLVGTVCAVLLWPQIPLLAAGFLLPCALGVAWLFAEGAWFRYIEQVWQWPALYAASPVVADPVRNGLLRTINWTGFHAVLLVGAVLWWRERTPQRWKLLLWLALGYAGVVLGWRFFPRYFFLILPPLVMMAARGLARVRSRVLVALAAAALAVPLVRFAPRYISLTGWSDLALDEDSRAAAKLLPARGEGKGDLFVWGYRPELYVYTGLPPATRYLESQAMTGVPADRHLTQSTVVLTNGTAAARTELQHARPTFIADTLSLYNPALAMTNYPELRELLSGYREVGRTRGTILYKLYFPLL